MNDGMVSADWFDWDDNILYEKKKFTIQTMIFQPALASRRRASLVGKNKNETSESVGLREKSHEK